MMDTRDGTIVDLRDVQAMPAAVARFFRPMKLAPTRIQRHTKKIGRNDPCPCGSGNKFKRCCLGSVVG